MVTTEQSELEEKEIINYWNLFISSIDDLFPAYKDFVHSQQPQLKGNVILLCARNQMEASAIQKKLSPLLKSFASNMA